MSHPMDQPQALVSVVTWLSAPHLHGIAVFRTVDPHLQDAGRGSRTTLSSPTAIWKLYGRVSALTVCAFLWEEPHRQLETGPEMVAGAIPEDLIPALPAMTVATGECTCVCPASCLPPDPACVAPSQVPIGRQARCSAFPLLGPSENEQNCPAHGSTMVVR